MEVKTEVNGAQPLPQRQQKNAGAQGNQNNAMKKSNQDGGGPAEKKPRFNNQGGNNQSNRGGFGKGFQNRNNRMNRNQNQNRGNMQNQNQNQEQQQQHQQNQGQGNVADESQLEKKPIVAEIANPDDNNKQNFNQRNNNNQQNRGQGGNRGGNQGGNKPHGGQQRGGQRNQNNRGDRQPGGGPGGNKDFRNQDDFHINQRLRSLVGPTYDVPPVENNEEVKFSGRNRLYVGNLTNDVTEEELQQLFAPYGEIGEVFCNAEKNFTFLKVDYHANAERAKRALDGHTRKGRQLRVRFAPNATILRVKNLTPYVSNELLYRCFEVFGPVERAVVIADDRGKSTGEGVVEFVKKSSANACLRFCNEKCFFLTSSLRPCVVEVYEPNDETDGLPEKSLNRKTQEYQQERSVGPRAAEINSFEHEYGSKWKQLYEMYKSKLDALKNELKIEEEKLEAQMELARFEHETEMLRQELRKRETDNERKKHEWEMREKQVEEMRKRDEENMRRQTNEMQGRMMRQDEDMRRRQQENALFMQAQQLSSLLDQDGFGGNGGGNFDNFGGNNNSPFQFQGGNNGGGGNMGSGNNNNNGPNGQFWIQS